MLEPMTVFNHVVAVARQIHQQVKKAKANQAQCQRLSQRIHCVTDALSGLHQLPDNAHFSRALQSLQQLLESILGFIKRFSQSHAFVQWLKAGTYAADFQAYTDQLAQSMQDLN